MKLIVKLGEKKIGELEVDSLPGVSHKFELNKKWYEIIKTSEDTIEVEEYAKRNSNPGE